MTVHTNSDNSEILNQVREFTELTIGDIDPKGMCFTICYSLSLYLQFHGIDNTIESGLFDQEFQHYIISIKDKDQNIIDPTIRQFDSKTPKIYFGKKSPNYSNFDSIDFLSIYDMWIYPLHHEGWYKPSPPEIGVQPNRCDIRALLKVTFKSAILLKKLMEQRHFISEEHSFRAGKYFEAIQQAYQLYWNSTDNLIQPALLEEYNVVFTGMKL